MNLYNQDCLPAMKEMPDNAFSLAIVDPPYGLGMDGGKRQYNKYVRKSWDREIPSEEYFNELRRVSDNQIIWGGNYFPLPPSRGWVVWDKTIHGNTFADGELAWTSYDRNLRIFPLNICFIGHNRIHPTQKPVPLYKWLLKNYAKPGQTILDTHLGSGSIAIACDVFGFDLTAFEIDLEYIEGATDRLKRHRAQGVLPL